MIYKLNNSTKSIEFKICFQSAKSLTRNSRYLIKAREISPENSLLGQSNLLLLSSCAAPFLLWGSWISLKSVDVGRKMGIEANSFL